MQVMTNKGFFLNILAMVVVAVLLLLGVLYGLDSYTQHGRSVEVPDLKNLTEPEAVVLLATRGLGCTVVDSDYVKTLPPGRIIEQNPASGMRVKQGRIIYLTINSLSIPLCVVPDVADNSSLRQAQAKLIAAGFRLTDDEPVPGEKDWVYGVKYNDRELEVGEQVPLGAILTLMVGNGMDELPTDSLGTDSLRLHGLMTEDDMVVDESWF